MSDELARLSRTEWVDREPPERRLRLRRDGTGYYERDAPSGQRPVHENLLWRTEGATLHLKFAHARLWTEVPFDLRDGTAEGGGRFGRSALVLAWDPYVRVFEERETAALMLESDAGAPLPS
jgi:hypothetical protein